MATCQKCGAELGGEERFCSACGAPVASYNPIVIDASKPMTTSEFEQYMLNMNQNMQGSCGVQGGCSMQAPMAGCNNYCPDPLAQQGMMGTPIDFAIKTNRVGIPLFFGYPYDPLNAADIWDPMNPKSAAGVLNERYRSMFRQNGQPAAQPAQPAYDPMGTYMTNMSEYVKSAYSTAMGAMAPYYAANAVQSGANAVANTAAQTAEPTETKEAVAAAEEAPAEEPAKLTKKQQKAAKKEQAKAEKAQAAEMQKKHKNVYAFD